MLRPASLLIALLAAAASVSGCGGGSGSEPAAPTTSVAAPTPASEPPSATVPASSAELEPATSAGAEPAPAAEPSPAAPPPALAGHTLASLLAAVPDTPETRAYVQATDYERARDMLALDVPDGTGEDEVGGYLGRLSGIEESPVSVAPALDVSALVDVEAWRAELGFSILELDRDLLAGSPPTQVTVLAGRIHAGEVEDAVTSEPVWSDLLQRVEHAGVRYYAWGEDGAMDIERRTAVRPLGVGGRLAVLGDGAVPVAVWARSSAQLEASLDGLAGSGSSLADVEAVRLAVEAFDAAGAYSLLLTADPVAFAGATLADQLGLDAEQAAALTSGPMLAPYQAAGLGGSVVAGAPAMVVVLVHADAAGAAANLDRLRSVIETGRSAALDRSWTDVAELLSIEQRDRVVVAVLAAASPRLWQTLFQQRDTLLASG